MHTLRCLAASLVLVSSLALGAGLDDVRSIDLVTVDKVNGQVKLLLVLEPGQDADRPDVLSKVKKKLHAYRYYVTSGQVWKNEPNSSPTQPVVLTTVVTGQFTPGIEAALATLRPELDVAPTAFAVVHAPYKGRDPK